MKNARSFFSATVILVILINALAIPPTYAAPKRQLLRLLMAGRVSNPAPNTILSGITAPRSSVGDEGDFYFDTRAVLFYGPKNKSGWSTPISLRGPKGLTGAKGVDGTAGADGKSSSSAGSSGVQGISGPVGPRGEPGTPGSVGPTGPAGAIGSSGIPGFAGTSGAPGIAGAAGAQGPPGSSGSPGSTGASGGLGLTGSSGSAGAAGAAGPSGPSGAAGSVGPSNVNYISIPAWTLSTATGGTSTDSTQIGTLTALKSYRYSIILHGVTAVTNAYFGVSMKVGPLVTTTLYETSITEGRAYVGASFVHRYTFIIQGTIVVGSSDTWLKVNVVDGAGVTSGVDSMSISGQAIVQLVGQVN